VTLSAEQSLGLADEGRAGATFAYDLSTLLVSTVTIQNRGTGAFGYAMVSRAGQSPTALGNLAASATVGPTAVPHATDVTSAGVLMQSIQTVKGPALQLPIEFQMGWASSPNAVVTSPASAPA
jgi:hypothetical protein